MVCRKHDVRARTNRVRIRIVASGRRVDELGRRTWRPIPRVERADRLESVRTPGSNYMYIERAECAENGRLIPS